MSSYHSLQWTDFVLDGESGEYPTAPQAAWIVGGNPPCTHPDSRKTAAALRKLGFVVVHKHFLTPTDRDADVVLPATTFLKCNDIIRPYERSGGFRRLAAEARIPDYDRFRAEGIHWLD